jgi:hypothetical protein
VDDFGLTPAERALFASLNARGVQPPGLGGEGLERIDTVLMAHGLGAFATEYASALDQHVDGIPVKVPALERVIASKRSWNRPKDMAVLPALEATVRARDGGDVD